MSLRRPDPGSFEDLLRPTRVEVASLVHKGFAYAIFECSGLRKLRTEKREARQVDDLCDRFNVTAV